MSMYKTVSDFVKSFPAVKELSPKQQEKCLEMFNAMKKEGMDDGKAIAIAMSRVKKMEMSQTFHFITPVQLNEEEGQKRTSVVEVLRVGMIRDRGLEITDGMIDDYLRNFQDNVYGTDLQVNLGHNREGEAAGWIRDLFKQGKSLMARVEWTELGCEKIMKKLYQFISSELAPEYPHAENGQIVPNVFIGAALTNTPAMKQQTPISLSEREMDLLTHKTIMLQKLISDLKNRSKLSEADVKFARTMLSEGTAEEQEAMKGDVEELEKKQAEQAAEEAKATEEAKQAEEQKLAEATKNTVSLSEFNAMKEKLETKELSEKVEKELTLSEQRPVGFRNESVGDVTKFMLSLNEAQRAAFVTLMGKVASVDFKERGSTHAENVNLNEGADDEAKVVALAEQLFKEKKANTITEAQKMAMEQLKK